jgi:hypothetical protein
MVDTRSPTLASHTASRIERSVCSTLRIARAPLHHATGTTAIVRSCSSASSRTDAVLRRMKALAFVLLVAACGSSSTSNPASPDAAVFNDAPPNVPAMITIAGTAYDNGQSSATPLAGVAITLKSRADDSTLASATSDAQGKYSLSVTTGGHVVDAYILATKSGYTDAAAFPPAPFAADAAMADSNLITTNNFNLLGLYTGQQASNGIVVAEVLDASSMPVAGAKVSSSPAAGSYMYSDSTGKPAGMPSTNTDGTAFLINVAAGPVSISATKDGATFKTHSVTAKPNTFTSTVITE